MVWGMEHNKYNQQLCFADSYIVLLLVHGLLTICSQLFCLLFSSFLSIFLGKEILLFKKDDVNWFFEQNSRNKFKFNYYIF